MRRTRARRRPRYRSGRRTFGRRLRKNGFSRKTGHYGRYITNYAANVPAFARRGMQAELKFVDTQIILSPIDNVGSIVNPSLNVVPQNTTQSGRIGRNIMLRKVMFKGNLHMVETLSDDMAEVARKAHDEVRVIFYLDKQTNGTAATPAQILENVTAGQAVHSFRNLANSKRFSILYDRKFRLNTGSIVENSGTPAGGERFISARTIFPFQFFLNVNIPIEYDAVATTGALSTQKTNNIGLLAISTALKSSIEGTFRIRYTG